MAVTYQCGEKGCPGGHAELTEHCNPRQLVEQIPVSIAYASQRPENCPKCGHRSFFRQCKCGAMLW